MYRYPLPICGFLTEADLQSFKIPTRGWCNSVIIDDRGDAKHDPMRTSQQQQLRPQHAVLRTIRRRLELQAVLPAGVHFNGEASLVRYSVGQAYGQHGDAAGMESGREWTVLVCLQAAVEGGETKFVHMNRTIKLERGDALVWPNYTDTGLEDERMDHESLPVLQGCKVVANLWFDS